ncbi:hypothetical protein P3X46_022688 [Hevea brasiliensis]|uniref:Phytocyanin domain-containing protein n=1 Tax=Hevea brasiliensis TaxID=3981 RepID=A0ABQ9L8J7_HEVBR|nr:early nodulin-like protein 12 [Hevea brasiliensis]KAJ9162960.1 hypothetical protein P3X46_022688 [Hevea brasiliensis]
MAFGLRILAPSLPLMLALCISLSQAKIEILVGGKQIVWEIPPSNNTLNLWAERTRFKVGDVLVWKYDLNAESVLQVTEKGYDRCNTSNPIKQHKDGFTKMELEHSGPFSFISGTQGHCEKGLKLIVVVHSEAR